MARRPERIAIAAVTPAIVLVGILSVRSTVAALSTLPYEKTLHDVAARRDVPPPALRAAAAANMRAAGWFEAPRYRMQAARLLLALPPAQRAAEAPRVDALLRDTVSRSPLSSYGWTLLAYQRLERHDATGAVAAWQTAVSTGRYVPDIMAARLLLGVRLMPLDAEVSRTIDAQVRLLAATDPASLAEVARRGGIEPLVRAALNGDPAAAAFERSTATLAAGAAARLASTRR